VKPFAGAVVVAAGKGNRLKSKTRKARIQLSGQPLFAWSLKMLNQCPGIGEICLAVHPGDLSVLRKWILSRRFRVSVRVVPGGAHRQDSVALGLAALSSKWKVCLVHDAARPFAAPSLALRCALSALRHGSGIAAVRVKDSIKQVHKGRVLSLPRQELWASQTPQAARGNWLKGALAWAARHHKKFTDEAGLLEAFGKPVRLVEGDDGNIKITTPKDWAIAKVLVKSRGGYQ
jgi:2-C-methyl-D-erythritol 4-phosphate cytidylyltransferase